MHVALVSEHWEPEVGGIQNYLKNLSIALEKMDTEVSRITPITHTFHIPILKPSWLLVFFSTYLLHRKKKIDVLLCGKGLFEGLLGFYFKKHFHVPYIVCTYAAEIEEWIADTKTRQKLFQVISYADYILTINKETERRLIDLGAQHTQFIRVTPGVEDRFFTSTTDDSVLKKYTIQKPYIFSVGRLVERKGFESIVQAFHQLDHKKYGAYTLVIAGEGPMRETLEKMAGDRVQFLGTVPDSDLPSLYANADLFALTPNHSRSHIEGFGIVYLESAASGVAAIGTRGGGVEDAIIDGQTGLLAEAENVKDISQKLERLLSFPGERQRMGTRARERARKEFQWGTRAGIFISHIKHYDTTS